VHLVLNATPPDGRPTYLPGHDAFALLVERYQGQVLRLAAHLVRDREEAKDVAQDAFLRAYRSLAGFRPELSFRNWLLAITVNAARDHHARWAGRHLRPLEDAPEPLSLDVPVDQQVEDALFAAQVRRCAELLSPREREVFVLRDLEGLEVDEIASLLALEPPTVRRHLARARLRLRQILEGPDQP
jgi:RNA polymerase sigma-70 factor (ECF subfamily)